MNPIERLLNIIAPEHCIECKLENYLLCPGCYNSIPKLGSICFVCQRATTSNEPCQTHKTKLTPEKVFCLNKYETTIKDYLLRYKFETKRAGGFEIARYINDDLPLLSQDFIVTWIPTTGKRIRQNGYDHAYLIAKNLAKLRKLSYQKLINRTSDKPLHNLNKSERLSAIKSYYEVNNSQFIIGAKILLIDDIATTGTTISYVSKILKKAGAKEIIACVFAKTY